MSDAAPEREEQPEEARHAVRTCSPRQRGFTLIEVMLVAAIIATMAALAVPLYGEALNRAKVVRATAEIRAVSLDIKQWEIVNGRLPDDLVEAGIIGLADPYGTPYEYLRIDGGAKGKGGVRKDRKLNPINADFDLYSMGRDLVSKTQITNKESLDDIIRANDGAFIGLASEF